MEVLIGIIIFIIIVIFGKLTELFESRKSTKNITHPKTTIKKQQSNLNPENKKQNKTQIIKISNNPTVNTKTKITVPQKIKPNKKEVNYKDFLDSSGKTKQYKNISQLKAYKINYLYHMTHIDNLASIVQEDLLSNNLAKNKKLIKTDISDHGVQDRRDRLEPIFKNPIHYYVPLYFNPRNPMLYRRKNLQPNIAILCFDPITIFNHDKVLFTDGNAAAKATKYFTDPNDLNYLDWNCLNSASYWNDFPDGKRKRCAEVLVPNKISFKEVEKILCYNSSALLKIRNIVNNNKIKVEFDGRIYF